MLEYDSYDDEEDVQVPHERTALLPKRVISLQQQPKHTDDKLFQLIEEHSMIQATTKKIMGRLAFCGGCLSLAFQMRANIFALYARTMDGYDNNDHIAIAIYLNYVVSGIFCLLFGFLGDAWRFDYLLVVANMIDVCTFFIEATATRFIVLAVAYIIGGQAMQSIVYGYMCKILPIYDSKQLQMRFILFYAVGYIIGPVTGGIIAYFTSYRIVFYVSACIATVLLIYTCIFFANTQTELVSMQIEFKDKLQSSGVLIDVFNAIGSDHIMPYCNININVNSNIKSNFKNQDKTVASDDEHVQVDDISRYRWFLIVLFTIIHGISFGGEASWISWYSVYIVDEFNNGTVAISTGQVSLLGLFFIVGTVITLKYIKLMQSNRDGILAEHPDGMSTGTMSTSDSYNDDINNSDNGWNYLGIHASNKYDICHFLIINMIMGCIVGIIVLVFGFAETDSESLWIYFYWIYCALLGLCFALVSSSGDSIMMQIMPKIAAGKGFGAKTATVYFIKAIPSLIVGLLWDSDHNWLFYIFAISFVFVLILLLVVVACEMFVSRERNSQFKQTQQAQVS